MVEQGLFEPEQLRELDRLAVAHPDVGGSLVLMERAGAAAYRRLRAYWPQAEHIVVVAGVGNNAGDGYVVARLAHADGLPVDLVQVGDGEGLRGDAARVRTRFLEEGGRVQPLGKSLPRADLLVDALFGIGLNRPLEGEWAHAVNMLNDSAAPVLALDVPAGIDARTGHMLGVAVRAAVTITFIGDKAGLYLGAGRRCAGDVVLGTLGGPAGVYARVPPKVRRFDAAAIHRALPPRDPVAHKGRFGHVLVVGGDLGMGGAVRMAGEAALRVGAGLVTVATRAEHIGPLLTARPEAMAQGVTAATDLSAALARASVLVLGPGLGQAPWGRELYAKALAAKLPTVIDADGLNLLAEQPVRRDDWVLTPHPGEAGRLLGTDSAAVQRDRLKAVTDLRTRYGGVVVLKGMGTLVDDGATTPTLCGRGNPGMASGGMGDVLSGVIGGLIAQGLSLADAARIGVELHAAAADDAARANGERGLLATDLFPYLRQRVNPDA